MTAHLLLFQVVNTPLKLLKALLAIFKSSKRIFKNELHWMICNVYSSFQTSRCLQWSCRLLYVIFHYPVDCLSHNSPQNFGNTYESYTGVFIQWYWSVASQEVVCVTIKRWTICQLRLFLLLRVFIWHFLLIFSMQIKSGACYIMGQWRQSWSN